MRRARYRHLRRGKAAEEKLVASPNEDRGRAMSADAEPNPLELEAQADELEADALRLRARAKRLRANTEVAPHAPAPAPPVHMTCTEYAASRKICRASVSRLLKEGMPCVPVGSTVRIDPTAADEWRRARERRPTTTKPARNRDAANDVDVANALNRAGLRVAPKGSAA